MSCLAEQAKILYDEAEENNLDHKAKNARWMRWYSCSLCEKDYHGVVAGALGWACWKIYVGRPEADMCRRMAIAQLGNGLFYAKHHEDALSVREAELAMERRLGASERSMLVVQTNLASTYIELGRHEYGLRMRRDVYAGCLRRHGEESREALIAANNYAISLGDLQRFEEAKSLLRNKIPVVRRVLGESHELTLRMKKVYARALYQDPAATLDELRESVTTFEDSERLARRVLGGAHPSTVDIELDLRDARAALRVRETPPPPPPAPPKTGSGGLASEVEDDQPERWPCSACTFKNEASRATCEICAEPRPAEPATSADELD